LVADLVFMLHHLHNDPSFSTDQSSQQRDTCAQLYQPALDDARGPIPEYVLQWPKYQVRGGEPISEAR